MPQSVQNEVNQERNYGTDESEPQLPTLNALSPPGETGSPAFAQLGDSSVRASRNYSKGKIARTNNVEQRVVMRLDNKGYEFESKLQAVEKGSSENPFKSSHEIERTFYKNDPSGSGVPGQSTYDKF